MFRTTTETTRRRILIRAPIIAVLALAIGGASASSPGIAAPAGGACKITFTRTSDVKYNDELGLSGLIIMGSHNFDPATRSGGTASTPFEALDIDGFLTLYILLSEWRASGKLEANKSKSVAFSRSDLSIALKAVEQSIRYNLVLVEKVEKSRPENYDDVIHLLSLKLEGMRIAAEGLRSKIYSSSGMNIYIPAGFMTARMGLFLDRLTGPDQLMMAQYLDRNTGDKLNVLCDASASSAFVGQLLCGYSFTTAKRRGPEICTQGLSMNRLADVPRCRRINSKDECTG